MLKTGLVSVSFRNLCVKEIIRLCAENGLAGIEWGGDIHVKPGEIDRAHEVSRLTREAGLTVTSYGSYYRVGTYGPDYVSEYEKILATASALGAPTIRVWAYNKGHRLVDKDTYQAIVEEMKVIADMSASRNITIAFECHCNTLTDEYHSTLQLLQDIGRDNVKMYWQPNNDYDLKYNLEAAQALRPYLVNVHVFNWPVPGVRKPLEEGTEVWMKHLDILSKDNTESWYELEFMPDDRPESLSTEAGVLNRWARQM